MFLSTLKSEIEMKQKLFFLTDCINIFNDYFNDKKTDKFKLKDLIEVCFAVYIKEDDRKYLVSNNSDSSNNFEAKYFNKRTNRVAVKKLSKDDLENSIILEIMLTDYSSLLSKESLENYLDID